MCSSSALGSFFASAPREWCRGARWTARRLDAVYPFSRGSRWRWEIWQFGIGIWALAIESWGLVGGRRESNWSHAQAPGWKMRNAMDGWIRWPERAVPRDKLANIADDLFDDAGTGKQGTLFSAIRGCQWRCGPHCPATAGPPNLQGGSPVSGLSSVPRQPQARSLSSSPAAQQQPSSTGQQRQPQQPRSPFNF